MKIKKIKSIIMILILLIISVTTVLVVIRNKKLEQQIPYIAFAENSTREDSIYICSDGDIYAATSEDAFTMDFAEMAEKIQEDDYADVLEFVGTTDAKKVKKMYRLFSSVVLNEDYRVKSKKKIVPTSQEYGGKVRYWSGRYYDEEGELHTRCIYQSNVDKFCSDIRAYSIVRWMYNCLKDYME